jgi:hypothetical protein
MWGGAMATPSSERGGRLAAAGVLLAVGGALVDLGAAVVPITVGADASPWATSFALVEGPWPATLQAVVPPTLVLATVLLWRHRDLAIPWLVGSASALVVLDSLLTATIVQDHLDWITGRWLAVRAVALLAVMVGAALAARSIDFGRSGPPPPPLPLPLPGWVWLHLAGVLAFSVVAVVNALGLEQFVWIVAAHAAAIGVIGTELALEGHTTNRWAPLTLVVYGAAGTAFWTAELAVREHALLAGGLQIAYDSSGGHTAGIVVAAATFAAVAVAGLWAILDPTTTGTRPGGDPPLDVTDTAPTPAPPGSPAAPWGSGRQTSRWRRLSSSS